MVRIVHLKIVLTHLFQISAKRKIEMLWQLKLLSQMEQNKIYLDAALVKSPEICKELMRVTLSGETHLCRKSVLLDPKGTRVHLHPPYPP